ncbi:MAG TPA: hypothetical protein DCP90_01755 [Clostridiales bacterium]|nr:MAG: hypothetical protein A2Y22_03435 [Clostridiales bacterium GWD2_32_59]HAN09319.1 hypothetical protein [Clostridiales bacterium]
MSKNNSSHINPAKLKSGKFQEEIAHEVGIGKLDNAGYKDLSTTKQGSLIDPTNGTNIDGHVRQMIGEYDRRMSTRNSGNYER